MSYRPDIVVTDENGTAVAWVEVKAIRQNGAYEYAEFFEAATKGGPPKDLRFFMLVTLAEISLWDLSHSEKIVERFGANLASYSMGLPRYLSSRTEGHPTYREMLAGIVFQWLLHLRAFGADESDTAERMLREKGFVELLSGAHLEFEQAA
jgi:hypothetical protein